MFRLSRHLQTKSMMSVRQITNFVCRLKQAGYTLFANHYKTTKLVRITNSVQNGSQRFAKQFFVKLSSSCFARQAVSMTNSKRFFMQTEEVRLKHETLDNRRIVCSMVFAKFRKLTIFLAKFLFCSGFVVVREQCVARFMEQTHHDLERFSRVHTCTAQFSLFRNNMTSEIVACGIAACAVVVFSNKDNVSRLYR